MAVSKMDLCKAGGMMIGMLIMVMAVAVVGVQPAKLKDAADKVVCPSGSLDGTGKLGVGYVYVSANSSFSGALAPEYDETNATYYVRLSDSGATYEALFITPSDILFLNSTVCLYNSESKRYLTWRQEGTDEYFLTEQEATSTAFPAGFRLLLADIEAHQPCPRLAYYLVSDPSSPISDSFAGLQTYEEDSAIYIKAAVESSTGNLPIILRQIYCTTTTIRSVTARQADIGLY